MMYIFTNFMKIIAYLQGQKYSLVAGGQMNKTTNQKSSMTPNIEFTSHDQLLHQIEIMWVSLQREYFQLLNELTVKLL